MRKPRIVIALAGIALLAACSSSKSTAPTTLATVATTPTTKSVAIPVGVNPSKSAKMICAKEGQDAIASALGVSETSISTPKWTDHIYLCTYTYPTGVIVLSVKELASSAETTKYFNDLKSSLGSTQGVGLGDGGFIAKNGNVVVRKDFKVLLIDTTGLPAAFGTPPSSRSVVATTVATALMGCWTGA